MTQPVSRRPGWKRRHVGNYPAPDIEPYALVDTIDKNRRKAFGMEAADVLWPDIEYWRLHEPDSYAADPERYKTTERLDPASFKRAADRLWKKYGIRALTIND